jgi:drug/metabolite transporter (DMT)-like permease
MIIALGALFGFFRLKVRYIAGIALGFAGAAVISRGATLTRSYMGIGLALLAGLSWALYCLFRLKWHETSAALLVRGFGLAAFTCGVLHLLLESTVIPSIGSAAATVAVGIVPGALANWVWDHGFRRGNSQQLTVLAYTSPLCSALLLVVLGLESVTPTLVIGAGLIVMAALLSRTPS